MESIRDIGDDAGPVFKCSRLSGAATYGTKSGPELGRTIGAGHASTVFGPLI